MSPSGLGIHDAPIAIHDVGRWLRCVLSGQFARGLLIAPGRFGLGLGRCLPGFLYGGLGAGGVAYCHIYSWYKLC